MAATEAATDAASNEVTNIDPTAPQKTVLITGATDGIGLALARLYQGSGWRVLTHGRKDRSQLPREAFFSESTYCQFDLSRPGSGKILQKFLTDQRIDSIDILILNAGLGYYGPVQDQSAESIQELLEVNLHSPMEITQALLSLVEKAHGKIAFISSVATALPCPEFGVYTATKASLEGFARSLRIELSGRVDVRLIHPGGTHTGMHEKCGIPSTKMDWTRFPSAETVAEKIVHSLSGARSQHTIGTSNRLARLAGRHLEGLLDGTMRRSAR